MYKKPDNTGALFQNKDKNKESQPDMTGRIKVNGKELRLAAWNNQSKSGQEYLSLKVSEFQDQTLSSREENLL